MACVLNYSRETKQYFALVLFFMLYKVSLAFRYDLSNKRTSKLLPYTLSRTRPTAGAFGISTYETTEKLGSADTKKYMFLHALKTINKTRITAQWFRIKHFKTARQNKGLHYITSNGREMLWATNKCLRVLGNSFKILSKTKWNLYNREKSVKASNVLSFLS